MHEIQFYDVCMDEFIIESNINASTFEEVADGHWYGNFMEILLKIITLPCHRQPRPSLHRGWRARLGT